MNRALIEAKEEKQRESLLKSSDYWEREIDKAKAALERRKADLQYWESVQVDPEKDTIETQVKKQYIRIYDAKTVSLWAFDEIPGFSRTKAEALEKVNAILDSCGKGSELDAAVKDNRRLGKLWAQYN